MLLWLKLSSEFVVNPASALGTARLTILVSLKLFLFIVAIVSSCQTSSRSDLSKSKVLRLPLPLLVALPGLPESLSPSSLPSPGLPPDEASIKDLIGKLARESTSRRVATVV